jgi:hypothetical protein
VEIPFSCLWVRIEQEGTEVHMGRKYNSLNDMKEFANLLSDELNKIGQNELADEIKHFSYNTYTTSSEYLGEFMFVLERIQIEINSPYFTQKENVKDAIKEIKRAFG